MREEGLSKYSSSRTPYPKPGSRMYEAFYQLYSNKGKTVDLSMYFKKSSSAVSCMRPLIDFYLLDIRHVQYFQFILMGEWINGKYIDYIVKENKDLIDKI